MDTDAEAASQRVSRVSGCALVRADMEISVPKTKCMHVKQQSPVSPVREEEYMELAKCGKLKFKCTHCKKYVTDSRRSIRIHEGSCGARKRGVFEEEYVVQELLDVRGDSIDRFYKVLWEGYNESEATWEPVRHLGKQRKLIAAFWEEHQELQEGDLVPDAPGEHRCRWCCKFCADADELVEHCKRCDEKPPVKVGSRAERAVLRRKAERAQSREERVLLCGVALENVLSFRYLGVDFQADGDMRHAIEVRMGMASARFGELWCIWKDAALSMVLKIRLFEAAVVSIFVYGCEVWGLTARNAKMIRGWCSRCLVKITGRSHREECVDPAIDLVGMIRKRRLKYVGHALRKDDTHLVRQVMVHKLEDGLRGGRSTSSILMDVPEYRCLEDVVRMAEDKDNWRIGANVLQSASRFYDNNGTIKEIVAPINTSRNNFSNTNTTTHRHNLRPRK